MADIWWHNVYTEVDGSEWHVCNLGLGLGPNNSDCDCDSECDTACVFPCQVLVEKSLGTPCLFFLIWWRGNPMLCTWQKVLIPPFTVTLDMSMFPRPLYHLTRVTRILASLIIIFRKKKKKKKTHPNVLATISQPLSAGLSLITTRFFFSPYLLISFCWFLFYFEVYFE